MPPKSTGFSRACRVLFLTLFRMMAERVSLYLIDVLHCIPYWSSGPGIRLPLWITRKGVGGKRLILHTDEEV